MQPGVKTSKRIPRSLLVGTAVVLAAVSLTAAYSRRAPEARGAALAPSAPLAANQQAALAGTQNAAVQAPKMVVTFRLDPAVTRGLYLGDRWVSPPSFRFAQPGTQYVVRAKVQRVDGQGGRVDLSGDWAASDPGMVAIDRRPGEVTLVVREPGESRVTVATGAGSKVLRVRALRTTDAMDVDIAQE